ncbi:MAG: hypothetical protein JJ863_23965 [Deltaproteobacteria bacterium]|nr:hypothetical protein [Deltaproteobacteria bacterium]
MEGLRILALACAIVAAMGGVLYAGVHYERTKMAAAGPAPAVSAASARSEGPEPEVRPIDIGPAEVVPPAFDPVLSVGIDLGKGAELFPNDEVVVIGGLRLGPFVFGPHAAEEVVEEEPAPTPTRRARRTPERPPGPRLHSDPGMHSILTARQMMANGERIQGSCYKYLSEVYTRAGHRSWRKRRIVYRAERDGPYADLDQIRPGDWLYIVNDPHRTPVGTHSVMFVRWTDRANGYASVISHPGWGAPHTGAERTYDLSQTYRIIRPTL